MCQDKVRLASYPCGALPVLTDDKQVLQNLKRILAKVQEMRDQRTSLEQQLREMIQKDDITSSLVTADRSEMKVGASCLGWGSSLCMLHVLGRVAAGALPSPSLP